MSQLWTDFLSIHTWCSQAASDPHWTAYLTAVGTPAIALVAVGIAHRQWATARDKVRLDLYDRRVAIYEAVQTAMGQMLRKGDVNQQDEQDYLIGVAGSQWLFGDEVRHFLEKEFWNQLMEHQRLVAELQDAPVGPIRGELARLRGESFKWFQNQTERVDALFMPYLSFHHLAEAKKEPLYKRLLQRVRQKMKRKSASTGK